MDIVGGNDPPISTYPPLEIDKDGTNRNSKCSSSSSSSSESGTSSSGSCSAYMFHFSGYVFLSIVSFKFVRYWQLCLFGWQN